MLFSVVVLSLALCVAAQAPPAQPPAQRVAALPRFSAAHGSMPSLATGYLRVNATRGTNIFYWLFDETGSRPSASNTILFWFQGGPGGSGELGLFYENGPLELFFDESTQHAAVRRRASFSWSDFGAIVFVDQPAGVSFSYSTDVNDYRENSDTRAAAENHVFISEFFKANKHYAGRDIWLCGESYAGVYLPMLADKLLRDASIGRQLKAVANGNPVFRCDRDEIGSTFQIGNLLYWNGLVSYDLMSQFWDAGCTDAAARRGFESSKCTALVNDMMSKVGSDFDGDDKYFDPCTGNGTLSFAESIGPCHPPSQLREQYLTDPSVIAAIHAKSISTGKQHWNYDMNVNSMLPYYHSMIENKVRLLIYSGLADQQTVPFAYTQPCLHALRRQRTSPWTPWTVNGHTAGHVEHFDAYTYVTIKGAGHESPAFQPLLSYEMIKRWADGQL